MFETIVNIYECSLIAWTSYSLSRKKNNKALVIISLLGYILVSFAFITFINSYSITESLYVIIDYLIAFLFVSIISTDKTGHRLLVSYLATNIIGIWNTIQNVTASYLLFRRFDIPLMMENYRLPLLIISQVMHTVILFAIIRFHRRSHLKLRDKDCFLLAAALLTCNLMTVCFESVGMHFENQDLYMILGIYLDAIFVVLLVYLFYSIYRHSQKEIKQNLELDILRYQQSSSEKIMAAQKQTLELRHDIKQFIQLIKKDHISSYEPSFQRIISQYDSASQKDLIPIKTLSPALDYVLNIKRDDAVSKGIDFVSAVNLTHPIIMADEDLCLMMANLLDNAIEHIGIKKRILVEIYDVKNMLMFRVTNSIDIHSLDPDGKPVKDIQTEKNGYGLKTIEKVANQYKGFFSYMEDEDNFIAAVFLPLSVVRESGLEN